MLPIVLRNARTHNLRGVDLELIPGQVVAFTGPSGAGKSSLAIDTLYAEGERRFVESFSPYARQFLERLDRPPIDRLDPIAATVAIDRKSPVKSSRSTLATMTDIEPYLAALFTHQAVPHCPECHVAAVHTSATGATDRLVDAMAGKRAMITYAVRAEGAEEYLTLRESLARDGYRRVWVGDEVRDIDELRPSELGAKSAGRVDVVVDRVAIGAKDERRIQEAIEAAWARGEGRAAVRVEERDTDVRSDGGAARASKRGRPAAPAPEPFDSAPRWRTVPVVRGLVCPTCARAFDPPSAGLFSYNSPIGACEACRGFGRTISVDWKKVVPDPSKTLAKGAIRPWIGKSAAWERRELIKFAARSDIPVDVPWSQLTEAQRSLVIEGEGSWKKGKYPGVRAWFKWLEGRAYKMHVRVLLSRYREYTPCEVCRGARLKPAALMHRVAGANLAEWHQFTVTDARTRIESVDARDSQTARIKAALHMRLSYLERVGLCYLTLDRQARTLSGGEAQRASLTTALGAGLTNTLFILDEPTIGLHASDVPALASTVRDLSRAGNSVIVVEHDGAMVRATDRVVELGPGAGVHGGTIIFDGTPEALADRLDTPTGKSWAIGSKPTGRTPKKGAAFLEFRDVSENNLRNIDAIIPLGVVCAVTGPSGSGKSTLAEEIIFRAVARACGNSTVPYPGAFGSMAGEKNISAAVLVDQSPLGRTARGNAATYTKAWDRLRARFAAEPEASRSRFTASHFSFNVEAGRCQACKGEGYETVEMQFLADVSLLCPTCQGKRFRPEILAIRHAGVSIDEALAMTVDEAIAKFSPDGNPDYVLKRALEPVVRVGLGYLPLGQPLSTLSGGEAQRLKLARALSEKTDRTLFVIDEPSAGLHAQDAAFVIEALHALAKNGASVVVVEHDREVIRHADWVVDLGPGGGPDGGQIVATGTPDAIARSSSKTGVALRELSGSKKLEQGDQEIGRTELFVAPSASHSIVVSHAREHNLKDISCAIPHGVLCVVTGPSGSGKSSLAFDVVFAEGQRRFMETLTPYARQFLPMLPRPNVESVVGVPPSIALEQRTSRGGANSTVATVTEIAHYLRLLFAKVGDIHCPECDSEVDALSPDDLFARLAALSPRTKHTVYAPAVRARKGMYGDLFVAASRIGVVAARVDGKLVAVDPPPKLAKTKEHSIDFVMHYGPLAAIDRTLFDKALSLGDGALRVAPGAPSADAPPGEIILSTKRACGACGTGVPELDPRWFSFNTKQGQCESCEGSGVEGGAAALEEGGDTEVCNDCGGARLAPIPRGVRLSGERYSEFVGRDVAGAHQAAKTWKFTGNRAEIAKAPHAELLRRLAFVERIGLGYLALNRAAMSLSGGEMQRLRLSAQLGSGLTGALYVLDEPTIGLHPRDTSALLTNLRALVDTGSTVLIVEHDAETIRAADYVIDLGPTGGPGGGRIVSQGAARDVLRDPNSPTAQALRDHAIAERPKRPIPDAWVELSGASEHNLKNVTFRVPLGRMCVVAGVSGSGKSTLVRQVFYPALRRAIGLVADAPGSFAKITGTRAVKRALAVDQSPIGRTPRSVPATFLGIWDDIRRLFASLPDAKMRGYTPARFSFNTATGGRCTTCQGAGAIVSEMAFMPDVVSVCEACSGARFEEATLDIRYGGRSIGDVLQLSAEEAASVFAAHPRIARPLATLHDLGVGYIQIGQGSNTLSGGEAQRLKLAAELTAGSAHEPTLYVLDEPTTGLHLSDVRRLVGVLEKLVARGDTLLIVEHHPDVIEAADWVVELGPEAGAAGGEIVFEGAPSKLRSAKTATGRVLAGSDARTKRAVTIAATK